jgi:hypothetical protein
VSALSALSVAIIVSLVFSTVVTVVMTEPLRAVLRQRCLSNTASEFWIPFTIVMLYVTPLLITALFEDTVTEPSLVNTLSTALASSLVGGFAALLVVGYQISRERPAR